MPGRHKRGNLSSTPSLLSIASSADLSIKEEILPSPATLAECDDQLETYQVLLQGKSKEKTNLIDQIKQLRAQREPLLKIKTTLQEEILEANHVINTKSEEVTQLKQRLRHHSEKQIQDNIERLEFQLRNNNYKPREEQKILDEIYMLKRSFKTLKEFELKQRENKKYRSERSRLIDQRNEVFSKIQAIILQDEELKKEITELRHIINSTMKTVDYLKIMRPDLEKAQIEEQRQKEEMRQKRLKEKARARKEQYILRQQERQKRWEEYEASREPYEDEMDMCKMLLAYLQSMLPSSASKPDTTNAKEGTNLALPSVEPADSSQGIFYSKPKCGSPERPRGKKKKAKAKRELRAAGKVKELSHPPDVLTNLGSLSVSIPRTTEDIPSCIDFIENKLRHFTILGKEVEGLVNGGNNEESYNSTYSQNCITPYSLGNVADDSSTSIPTEEKLNSHYETPQNKNLLKCLPPSSCINKPDCTVGTHSQFSLHSNHATFKPNLIPDPTGPKSFFSISVPVVTNKQVKKEPSLAPTYASVAARIHV